MPDNAEMAFWHAVALASTAGSTPRARCSAARSPPTRAGASWCGACPGVEQLPKDPKLMEEIVAIR